MVQERFLSFPVRGIFNGVSQQPTVIRREGFAESQENGYSSIIEGLRKRPPTEHIKKLKADTGSDTDLNSVHIIDRGSSDQHLVLIEDETLTVYDLDGTAKTVHTPDGTSYLSVAADDPEYRFLTLADVTFSPHPVCHGNEPDGTRRPPSGGSGGPVSASPYCNALGSRRL